MKGKLFLVTVVTAFLVFVVAFRHHIRDLTNVVTTYSTFYNHLRTHPDILFRYPPNEDASYDEDIGLPEPVPKIIHQIFLTDNNPSASLTKYLPAIASCRAKHPHWTHQLWSDANGTAFIAEHYPDILPHYTAYRQSIQRANVLRYALLHHFGGVYLDLDITCLVPLDAPLGSSNDEGHDGAPSLAHLPWLTPAAHPAGVNNAFILARAGHPLLSLALARLPARDLVWGLPYVENMLSTGCMFFSNAWTAYVGQQFARAGGEEHGAQGETEAVVARADRVYVLADAAGDVEPHMLRGRVTTPLFAHGGASSWHGWDAAAIVLLGAHYRLFAAGAIVGVVAAFCVGWCRLRGRSVGPRRWARRSIGVGALLGLERKSAEHRRLMGGEV